ncbi:STAS domain-containing protein [Nocardia cyriacigeorgica]|uniref:STAS domain-containing protein n=1 Tax=Nocardia cyriacigeorgica TaxID=135487 RepID=UPI0024571C36|nr:STAS domain-containing protein [Nocardia cyriacigeorgica]
MAPHSEFETTPSPRRELSSLCGRPDPKDRLVCCRRSRGRSVVLSVRGEADAFTLPVWRQEIAEAAEDARAKGGGLIVDTTRLNFLSWRTLATLAEDAERFGREGVPVCLVNTSSTVFRLAGADARVARLPIHSTVVSALTRLELGRRGSPPQLGTRHQQVRTAVADPRTSGREDGYSAANGRGSG